MFHQQELILKDVDLFILRQLDGEELYNQCQVNSYFNNLCHHDTLLKLRLNMIQFIKHYLYCKKNEGGYTYIWQSLTFNLDDFYKILKQSGIHYNFNDYTQKVNSLGNMVLDNRDAFVIYCFNDNDKYIHYQLQFNGLNDILGINITRQQLDQFIYLAWLNNLIKLK